MIRDVVGWLALSDAVAAAGLGLLVYAAGRRTAHPVPARTAIGLAVAVAIPGVVLYGLVWAFVG